MAMYLVLEDFNGNIGGPSQTNYVQAGTLLDDAVYDIAAILAQGCPVVLYNAGTMAVSLAAFMSSRTSPQMIANDGNLTALLAAAGVFGELPTGPAGGDLFKTYPNPWVAAVHETNGPTRLQIAGVADGSVLARVGAAVVGVAPTFPPNGAAGGDLGGAYPNPTVVAIEETAGPTRLAAGAIADGQVVKRVGATIVGTPATFPPNGAAGGDLGGNYPNPTVVAIEETSGPTRLVTGAVPTLTFLQRVGATVVGTDPNTVVKGPWANVIYVDDVRGSDVTGARGNANLPFATPQAAINAALTSDEIQFAPRNFALAATLTVPATVVRIALRGYRQNFTSSTNQFGHTVLRFGGGTVFTLGTNLGLSSFQISDMTIVGTTAISADGSAYAAGTFLTLGFCGRNTAFSGALTFKYSAAFASDLSPSFTGCFLGNATFTSCRSIAVVSCFAEGGTWAISNDPTDPLAPALFSQMFITQGTIVGTNTNAGAGVFTFGPGTPQLVIDQTSAVGGLKATGLTTSGANVPLLTCCGYIGGITNGGVVDFASAGSELPDTATVMTIDLRGARLYATRQLAASGVVAGVGTVKFKVGGAAANFQSVALDGVTSLPGCTFIADAAIHMTARGADLPSAVYNTPGANGDINPPMLTGVVDVSAGGSVAKSWVQLGYAGFTRSGAACDTAFLTASAQLSDPVIAAKTTVGLTITSNVVGGDSACNWMAVWK